MDQDYTSATPALKCFGVPWLARVDALQPAIDELFACSAPEWTPGGKRVFRIVGREELDSLLG